ncbi:hypothetical protein Q766_04900 [Flavobacterium subsaxonicum WB 4.1-42 = DSM 21790]|uniref:DUF4595 domain-containing protein n=2 Tax=Flavobacterium TaxID=237 RepID=A0A0A2N1D7_9FLAO|nr:hypothetical protein Q766_04900 [Flavobacterium subsaxonicum WB 4.1-42 = DSM 21790]
MAVNDNSNVLVKKIIITDAEGTHNYQLNYDGNHLVDIRTPGGTHETIVYTGHLISEWQSFGKQGVILYKKYFEYSADKLVRYIVLNYESGQFQKYNYTNNTDGSISYALYSGATETTINNFVHDGKIYSDKIEINIPANGTTAAHIATRLFTYDGKNNPFKNVTSFDKIYFATNATAITSSENFVSETLTSFGQTQNIRSASYVYNAANFPETAIVTEISSGNQTTTNYLYN